MDWSRFKSDFMSFSSIGDSIAGTIIALGMGADFNDNPCPQLTLDTDDGVRKVTCGQKMLQATLAEKEPDEGDHITITYYADGEKKAGRNPAKLFTVEVIRKGAEEPVAAGDLA